MAFFALPSSAVLIVSITGLHFVQTWLADENPVSIFFYPDSKKRRFLRVATRTTFRPNSFHPHPRSSLGFYCSYSSKCIQAFSWIYFNSFSERKAKPSGRVRLGEPVARGGTLRDVFGNLQVHTNSTRRKFERVSHGAKKQSIDFQRYVARTSRQLDSQPINSPRSANGTIGSASNLWHSKAPWPA